MGAHAQGDTAASQQAIHDANTELKSFALMVILLIGVLLHDFLKQDKFKKPLAIPSPFSQKFVALFTEPSIEERDPHKIYVHKQHLAWMIPLLCLLMVHFILNSEYADTEACPSREWQPMIRPLGKLYLPSSGEGIRLALLDMHSLQPLFKPNIIGVLTRLLPFEASWPEPSLLLPLIPQSVNANSTKEPYILTKADAWERDWFFIPNYALLIGGVILILEGLRYLSMEWPAVVSCLHQTRTVFSHYARAPKDLVKPLLGESKAEQVATPALALAEQSKSSESAEALVNDPVEKPVEVDATVEEPLKGDDEAEGRKRAKSDCKISRSQDMSWRHTIYIISFVVYWLAAFQGFFWLLIDFGLAGGMMSITTGMPYEFVSLVIIFELIIHLFTGTVRYIVDTGVKHPHPTFLLIPMFLPFIGNLVHIYKDHVAMGLCFQAAHCRKGLLGEVGYLLGYYSLVATYYPLPHLLAEETCREGLRLSHIPLMEANPLDLQSQKISQGMKRTFVSTMISFCTRDKRVRAMRGEAPHMIAHVLYAYFFGGGAFIFFAMLISFVKITMIDLVMQFLLPPFLETFGCSSNDARRYLLNGGQAQIVLQIAIDTESEPGWDAILMEFFGAEIGELESHGIGHAQAVLMLKKSGWDVEEALRQHERSHVSAVAEPSPTMLPADEDRKPEDVDLERTLTPEGAWEVPQVVREERVVEVPQVETREVIKRVIKEQPEIVQRQVAPGARVTEMVKEIPVLLVQEQIVEVPEISVEEIIRQVPNVTEQWVDGPGTDEYAKPIVQYVDKRIPKKIAEYIEKVVEVPQIVYVEQAIEVPGLPATPDEDVVITKQVALPQIQVSNKAMPVEEWQYVERVVEVPMVSIRHRPHVRADRP